MTDHHRLEQRRVRFDFEHTPLHWVPDEPEASHIMNTLHLILPAGEFWFCRVYNKALPLVKDVRLRDDVQGFVRQEAQHARAHDSALSRWLQPWWLRQRVGIIAAVEHFTCVLGDWIITTRALDHADPVMLDLLRWHGAEEVEHRCVAHDLHVAIGGSMLMRWLYMPLVSAVLIFLFSTAMKSMMRQDPVTRYRPGFLSLWRQLGRRGVLPRMGHVGRSVLRYFNPRFHPRTEGDLNVALDYLTRSPAAQRAAAERGSVPA